MPRAFRSANEPPRACDSDLSALHLTLPGRVPSEPGHARPPGGYHVKVRSISPAKHAGETTAIERDSRQPLTTTGLAHLTEPGSNRTPLRTAAHAYQKAVDDLVRKPA